MKRIWIAAVLLLILCGCGRGENPYRVDTVIRIPANPTQAPTESAAETEIWEEKEADSPANTETYAMEETETAPEKAETAGPTEAEKATGKKKTTPKTSSKKTDTKKETKSKETEPKETEPKETEPKETRETAPAATQPPATEPPLTQPPATEPISTQPPVTVAHATEPVPTEPEMYDISGYFQDTVGYDVAAKMNEARLAAGLGELSLDEYLSAIASCRAWEISQLWSHTRPDGRSYATVLSDYGYSGGAVGELLVYVTGTGDGVYMVEKWLESDSHRAVILSEAASAMGIGVFRANGYTFVCCMVTV